MKKLSKPNTMMPSAQPPGKNAPVVCYFTRKLELVANILWPIVGANAYQTWQDDELPRWTPAYKVTTAFDQVVFQDHVTG